VEEPLRLFGDAEKFATATGNPPFAAGAGIGGGEFPARFVPNYALDASVMQQYVPTGYLRAPGSNGIAFATQSFIDELAHAAGKDPLQFRLDLLAAEIPAQQPQQGGLVASRRARRAGARAREVRMGHAEASSRHRMGVAFHFSHRGYFAEVVQATVSKRRHAQGRQGLGRRRRRQPDHQSQWRRESGVGLRARRHLGGARAGDHDRRGRAVQNNFTDFPLIRLAQSPPVELHWNVTEYPPTGLGEPALPPVVPALCNAIYAATGKRIRSLPLSKSDLRWS
jgi:isoquinoline 1-oxidoreductase beta subunit